MKVYGGAYNTQTRNEYMISDRFRTARTLVGGTTCIHLGLIWMKVYGGAYNTQTRNEYMISDRFRTARTLVAGTTCIHLWLIWMKVYGGAYLEIHLYQMIWYVGRLGICTWKGQAPQMSVKNRENSQV